MSAIDHELADALAIEPSAEFLARVRARIATEPASARRGMRPALLAVGAVAIAAVVAITAARWNSASGPASESPSEVAPSGALDAAQPSSPAPRSATTPGATGADDVAAGVQVVRIGRDVPPPAKVADVQPIYPAAARAAEVEGLVILEVIVDEQGFVADASVLRSIPMLDQAAVDAVLQWRYEPVLQDGVPVVAVMTVTINFTLQ